MVLPVNITWMLNKVYKGSLTVLLSLGALALLQGCSQQVPGELFIVTAGRQNIRLGLTEIQALSEKRIGGTFRQKKVAA